MTHRVITFSREYGSGGAAIAAVVAAKLGWRLLDRAVLSEVARTANVDPALAREYDERVDSWLHRVAKRALWRGALAGVASVSDRDFFDAETMATLSREVILHAAEVGNCVIVGRGSQCLLQNRPDTFHVFIYAPQNARIERLRARVSGHEDLQELAKSVDKMRSDYIRAHFGCDWQNPHLYDLMVSSAIGEEHAAAAILCAVRPLEQT